ncbi:MAG: hypothetical protein ACP5D5_09110 [Acidithiobacillus sp.]|uniref:hypothetical protein n=1 Tax=Acidithiobacillus sp. TaxID=1872118 RepID=UPI003CFCEE72
MADMKVAMTLTVRDLGTVKLERFSEVLKGLQAQLAPLNEQLKAFQEGMNVLSESVTRSMAPFRSINRSIRQTAVVMGDAADAAKGFAESMGAAAGATADMATSSMAATRGLTSVGASAERSAAQVSTLEDRLRGAKGLMEAIGAIGGLDILDHSVKAASKFQQTKLQIRARDLPTGEYGNLLQNARRLSGKYPYSMGQILKTELAELPMMPGQSKHSQMIRAAILPKVLSTAFEMQRLGSKLTLPEIAKELFGLVDMAGGSKNLQRAEMVLSVAGRATGASGGKITPQAMHTSLRYLNAGISGSMGYQEYLQFMALVDQFKGHGEGGSSRAATVYNNIFSAATRGIVGKGLAMLWEKVGLISPKDVHPYGHSSTRVMLAPGALKGSELAASNPGEWLATYGTIPFLRYTQLHWKQFGYKGDTRADFTDPQQIAHAMAQVQSFGASFGLGGQAYANAAAIYGNPARVRTMQDQVVQMQKFESSTEYMKQALKTLSGSWQNLRGQLETTGILIGSKLLPVLTAFNDALAGLLRGLNWLMQKVPLITDGIAGLTVAITGLLGVKAVEWFLGLKGSILKLMGITVKAEAASDGAAAAAGGLATRLGGLSLKMVGLAGVAGAAGYAVGTLINHLIDAAGRDITGQKGWSLGGQIYQWTHAAPGSYAKLRAMATAPIGARFNNPGDLFSGPHGTFGHYANPGAGLYAMAALLKGPAYAGGGLDTIRQIVTKYAPPGQNNTAAYIRHVASMMRVSPTAKLNLNNPITLDHLMVAMMAQEGTLKYFNPADVMTVAKLVDTARLAGPGRLDSEQRTANAMYAAAQKVHVQPGSLLASMATPTPVKLVNAFKKKVAEAQRARWEGQKSLRAAFDRRLHAQAVLTNLAGNIRAQYAGIFNPESARIPEILHKYSVIADRIRALHPHAASMAMAVAQHQVLGVRYKMASDRLRQYQRTLHLGTTDNAALVRAGVISHATAAQRDIALQQSLAPQMLKAADAALKYAKALKDPALVASLQEQIAGIKAMGQQLGYYQEKVKGVLKNSFSGLLDQMMKGQKTWGQMLYSFFGSIADGIDNLISKKISNAIVNSLFSGKNGGGLGSLIGVLFGDGNSAAAATGGPTGGGFLGNLVGDASGLFEHLGSWLSSIGLSFATGADYIPHTLVAQLHKGEMVLPADAAAHVRAGGFGPGHSVTYNINAVDSKSFLDQLGSVQREMATMVMGTMNELNLNGSMG